MEEATHCTPSMGHRPAGGIFACHGYTQRVQVLQITMAECPLVNMTAHGCLKVERKCCNRHQHNDIGGRLISDRQNSPEEYPWHNWYKPEKANRTEVAAVVAQCSGQEHHLLCPSGSVQTAEPQHDQNYG